MKRKGGFLLFLSACIPGCGQMYQGYMKRGVSLLGAGCLIIAVASFLHLGELSIFLPLLWLYAFFDTYNIRNQTDEQAEANPDRWLFNISSMDSNKMTQLFRGRQSFIGWGLVVLGVVALYNTMASRFFYDWLPNWLFSLLSYDLPRLVVIALIIALGVWFIRGSKPKASSDEYTSFTPPAENTEDNSNE